jgi:hypothetical protein
MAEKEKVKALLSEGENAITQVERVMLNQLMYQPGWKVLVKLFDAVCTKSVEAMAKLNPEDPDYDRLVVVRAQNSRITNETVKLIRDSVLAHVNSIIKQEEKENEEADARVERMTGIHAATPTAPDDAIKKTFGIHLAKPVKKQKKEEK